MTTTKEQERAALAKIRDILNELEPGSYVRAAFDSCIEYAEDNIKNDWACSPSDMLNAAKNQVNELAQACRAGMDYARQLMEDSDTEERVCNGKIIELCEYSACDAFKEVVTRRREAIERKQEASAMMETFDKALESTRG